MLLMSIPSSKAVQPVCVAAHFVLSSYGFFLCLGIWQKNMGIPGWTYPPPRAQVPSQHPLTCVGSSLCLSPPSLNPQWLQLSSSLQILGGGGGTREKRENSILECPLCQENLQSQCWHSLFSPGLLPDLCSLWYRGTWVHQDLVVSSECRTWVRWAVSNSTTASGKQNSLQHFSWPPLPNHPRLQLMWFWKMLLFHSPKHLEKKRHKTDVVACFFFFPPPPQEIPL